MGGAQFSATIHGVRAVPTLLCGAACAWGAIVGVEACASFGASEPPPLLDAASNASLDDADAGRDTGEAGTEAGPDGGKADGSFVKPPLTCGTTACKANERCCMSGSGRVCATTCPDAWEMECFGPADCQAGSCCYDTKYPTAYCAASCNGKYKLCTANADCASPPCVTVGCDKATVGFRVCPGGGPGGYHDYPGTIPSCTTP